MPIKNQERISKWTACDGVWFEKVKICRASNKLFSIDWYIIPYLNRSKSEYRNPITNINLHD